MSDSSSPLSGGLEHKLKKKKSALSLELRGALLATAAFLLCGLFLGYFLLHNQRRKVILHIMNDPWNHGKAMIRGRVGFRHHFYTGAPRFVSIVMPSVVNPATRHRRLRSIQDTWGPYARAIYVVHNISEFPAASHAVISDTSKPQDPYEFPQLLLVPSDIGLDDGVPRLYHVIRTVFEQVNPDFAFFVNDHTFVIPEHLCKYLEYRTPDQDMYEGHALKNGGTDIFNSGAAGYLLSRETMRKLIEKWNEKDPECWLEPQDTRKWLQDNPGLMTVKCLNSLGITAIDTRAKKKWHRFHAFPLTRVVSGHVDEWYMNKHKNMAEIPGFDSTYEELLSGQDCCSKSSVSFHYVEHMEARALFAVRNALLKNPHLSDHELKNLVSAEWPKEATDIGSYSHGLPSHDQEEAWKNVMEVLRKISTRETQRDC